MRVKLFLAALCAMMLCIPAAASADEGFYGLGPPVGEFQHVCFFDDGMSKPTTTVKDHGPGTSGQFDVYNEISCSGSQTVRLEVCSQQWAGGTVWLTQDNCVMTNYFLLRAGQYMEVDQPHAFGQNGFQYRSWIKAWLTYQGSNYAVSGGGWDINKYTCCT